MMRAGSIQLYEIDSIFWTIFSFVKKAVWVVLLRVCMAEISGRVETSSAEHIDTLGFSITSRNHDKSI